MSTPRGKRFPSGDAAKRPRLVFLLVQMIGARDQVADAAKRLPGECGDLYEEDQHRLHQAVAALDRIERQWKAEIG